MDKNVVKRIIQNYEWSSIEDIEQVLEYIADIKKEELAIDFDFEVLNDDGGCVKPERSETGKQQVEIGISPLFIIKDDKELGLETNVQNERKEFIEAVLSTFHELRHVKQNHSIIDNPVVNNETLRITRERVINESFPGFINQFNYESSLGEIDAMKTSLIETANFFQEMESDITPDEIFEVMKEKELSYTNYDLTNFGDSYESALEYFDKILEKQTEIKGFPQLINSLPEDKKTIFDNECQELMEDFNLETDIDKKLNLLKEMSLIMTPELKNQFPLSTIETEKQVPSKEETKNNPEPTLFDKFGNKLDSIINKMENFEGKMNRGIDNLAQKTEQFAKGSFEQLLANSGFTKDCITGIKQTIMTVNPKIIALMDKMLGRTKDKSLTKEEKNNGKDQESR